MPNNRLWRASAVGPLAGAWRVALDSELQLPSANQWQSFTQGPHSHLFRLDLDQRAILAKCIRPRSWPRDTLRKYVNSQARREWRSAFRMREAGLSVPDVHGWAYSLNPSAPYESILFMDEIVGYRSALRFIRQSRDSGARLHFFRLLAADMARLHGHRFVHKDGHFGNVGRVGDDALVWIDNDIRHARTGSALRHGFRHMLKMLRRTARQDVSTTEWRDFHRTLARELERWPNAKHLVDAV